jgi:hypothetical protein
LATLLATVAYLQAKATNDAGYGWHDGLLILQQKLGCGPAEGGAAGAAVSSGIRCIRDQKFDELFAPSGSHHDRVAGSNA